MIRPSSSRALAVVTIAKAVIVREGRLLAVRNRDAEGDWYCFPGGRQKYGERITDALLRECEEEIGCEVRIGPPILLRDYMGWNHEFADEEGERDAHQLEVMFACELPPGATPHPGTHPDPMQTGVEWLPLSRLPEYRFYPKAAARLLTETAGRPPVTYLGDVN